MLEIGEADDAVLAVRRAHVVGNVVAVESEHPLPAPRKLPACLRTHGADTGDDHIEGLHLSALVLTTLATLYHGRPKVRLEMTSSASPIECATKPGSHQS